MSSSFSSATTACASLVVNLSLPQFLRQSSGNNNGTYSEGFYDGWKYIESTDNCLAFDGFSINVITIFHCK